LAGAGRKFGQPRDGDVGPEDFSGDLTTIEDKSPMADFLHLLEIRRDEENSAAALMRKLQIAIDLGL
jgi:hypothetical protein